MNKLVLIGGGGHCRSCIDVIESTNEFEIIGILDSAFSIGDDIYGYNCIGNDNNIPELADQGYLFLICIGQIYSSKVREECFSFIKASGGELATVVSSRAWISRGVSIGEGTIVMHDALINSQAKIGDNCIINTKALIEHDTVVANNCHISTGALINGSVKIGDSCFIGSGAVLVESANVPNGEFVKANTIFKRNQR